MSKYYSPLKPTSTGFIGVHTVLTDRGLKYKARIRHKGKDIHLGNFNTGREAELTYLYAKVTLHEYPIDKLPPVLRKRLEAHMSKAGCKR